MLAVLLKSYLFCGLEQERTDGLSPWGREVLHVKPGLRPWSLTCGSVKSSRGGMGHGGGSSWAILNCELFHLQAAAFCLVRIILVLKQDNTLLQFPMWNEAAESVSGSVSSSLWMACACSLEHSAHVRKKLYWDVSLLLLNDFVLQIGGGVGDGDENDQGH